MDKKKKHKIILGAILGILLLTAVIVLAIVFASTKEVIADAENKYSPDYNSFCTYEQNPNITIDGVLDETEWEGKTWFKNTYLANTTGTMPVLTVTGFPTEQGVYIASIVYDTNLVNNGQKAPATNSTWELYVTACDTDETAINDKIYQKHFEVDMRGDIYGEIKNVDRAIVVDGELNNAPTTSATLEMFVPWAVLEVDTSKGIPKTFGMITSYRAVLEGNSSTSQMAPVNSSISKIKDYYYFDLNGYTNGDREGSILGDNKFGYSKTANWDISKEADGIVQSSVGTEHHKIFFSEEYGSNFIVEATIIPVGDTENSYPKVGAFFGGTDGGYHTVFLDYGGKDGLVDGKNGTKNFADYSLVTLNNVDSSWSQKTISGYDKTRVSAASAKEGVKFTVIKLGGKFYYFADGKFLTSQELKFMDKDVVPGFYSLGANAIIKDYSCEEITANDVAEYLNSKGVYTVAANVKGAGGTAKTSTIAVKKGGNYDVTITTKTGYEVKSILVNGVDKLSDAKKNAVEGVYTISGVKANQDINITFDKVSGYKLSGTITNGKGGIDAKLVITGVNNKVLRYEIEAGGKKGYSADLPTGTYQVYVEADGYKSAVSTIKLNKDTTKNFALTTSGFPEKVEVNGKTLNSSLGKWDLSNEYLGKVATSYAKGGKISPLYFPNTGSDFVLEATISYTTSFQGGIDYQSDLMGGFVFNDGTNSAWIMARGTGVVYTGWKYVNNLIDYNSLSYPDAKSVQFAIAKVGDQVNLYFNGELATVMDWAKIAPKINSKSKVALGLYMVADKTADIEFGNYSVKTGTAAATSYINSHELKDKTLAANPLFSEVLTVNGTKIKSLLSRWDLTNVGNNVVSGSYAMGSKTKPLYFTAHGNTALMTTTIEYTTEFKVGETYQPDLMGGFTFSDGKNTGFIVACKKGITYTGWKQEQGLIDEAVLTYPEKRSVEMTIALRNGYMYVFMDGEYVAKKNVSKIVAGATASTDLAIGLYMVADRTADIRFSNTSITTDVSSVDTYISEHR